MIPADRSLRTRCAALALAVLASGGCVGPNFHRPAPPEDAGYSVERLPDETAAAPAGGEAQHFNVAADVSWQWWTLFQSPKLNSLIEQAFKKNPGIANAQAALRQAQEMAAAQRGFFYPTVAVEYSFQRQKVAGNQAASVAPGVQGNGTVIEPLQNPTGSPHNAPLFYNTHTAQATVSYNPDVFGANRRQVESLDAQAEMQRYNLEAAYMTLASNLVSAAIQEASIRDQLAAVQAIVAENRHSLAILDRQFKDGYVMRADVAAQEAQLAQAEALLPPLQTNLEQTRDLIRALAGDLPNVDLGEAFQLSDLTLPHELPLGVPSRLTDQRPDVRAAEAALHSASADVGAAVAARLPAFAITGAAGGVATQFNQMFAPGGPFWSIILGVAQPVFDGGTLRHRQHAAEQALIQAAAQYQSTVLGAYQNVADTLHAIHGDADGLTAAVRNEQAAKVQLDIAQLQLASGQVAELYLLQAEEAYQQAVIGRIQAQTLRFGDSAALFMALGGGWWNRQGELSAN
jgi:NodT family efflux transporter outer membrane factor (OMF) lipoprotein